MNILYIKNNYIFLFLILFFACKQAENSRTLPILGNRDVAPNGDTLYLTIPDFAFFDQDSNLITQATFQDKIYVADFFFTFCPTICPKVKANMLKIYDEFKQNEQVLLLSHTIAPKQDSVAALKIYANKLNIETAKWHLVTGNKDSIYNIAPKYLSIAKEDGGAPGGFDHSGNVILIDKKRRIRSFANGTNAEEMQRLIRDIHLLLQEK